VTAVEVGRVRTLLAVPMLREDELIGAFLTTKPAGEGTGLGLSISHDVIVKQHSGSIEVDTQPGEYTEVRIILPRAAAFIPRGDERDSIAWLISPLAHAELSNAADGIDCRGGISVIGFLTDTSGDPLGCDARHTISV
jgi:hypothetical protein